MTPYIIYIYLLSYIDCISTTKLHVFSLITDDMRGDYCATRPPTVAEQIEWCSHLGIPVVIKVTGITPRLPKCEHYSICEVTDVGLVAETGLKKIMS